MRGASFSLLLIKLFLSKELGVPLTTEALATLFSRLGVSPLLTGVEGGKVLSIYSGLTYGPQEIRLLREGVRFSLPEAVTGNIFDLKNFQTFNLDMFSRSQFSL